MTTIYEGELSSGKTVKYYLDNETTITAHVVHSEHDEEKVGEIVVNQIDVEQSEIIRGILSDIEVDEHYRRQGIASTLLKLAKEYLNMTHVPAVTESDEYEYSLRQDGEKLIAGCLKSGVITPNMCIFAHSTPLILAAGYTASDDPGLDSVIVSQALLRATQEILRQQVSQRKITNYFTPAIQMQQQQPLQQQQQSSQQSSQPPLQQQSSLQSSQPQQATSSTQPQPARGGGFNFFQPDSNDKPVEPQQKKLKK